MKYFIVASGGELVGEFDDQKEATKAAQAHSIENHVSTRVLSQAQLEAREAAVAARAATAEEISDRLSLSVENAKAAQGANALRNNVRAKIVNGATFDPKIMIEVGKFLAKSPRHTMVTADGKVTSGLNTVRRLFNGEPLTVKQIAYLVGEYVYGKVTYDDAAPKDLLAQIFPAS